MKTRLAWLLCTALTAPAHAAPGMLVLSPATSHIEYTAFAFGLLPMSARFDEFAGTITAGPASSSACHVQVSVRIASLHMSNAVQAHFALGSAMLDAAHFPTMSFTGQCSGATLNGALTLHGVTRPLVLSLARQGGQVIATGILQRRDYAIAGMAGLVGQRIRIRLQTILPQGMGGAL